MNILTPFPKSKCLDAENGARLFRMNVGNNALLHDTNTQERYHHLNRKTINV